MPWAPPGTSPSFSAATSSPVSALCGNVGPEVAVALLEVGDLERRPRPVERRRARDVGIDLALDQDAAIAVGGVDVGRDRAAFVEVAEPIGELLELRLAPASSGPPLGSMPSALTTTVFFSPPALIVKIVFGASATPPLM